MGNAPMGTILRNFLSRIRSPGTGRVVLAGSGIVAGVAILVFVGLYSFWLTQSGSDEERFAFSVPAESRPALLNQAAPAPRPLSLPERSSPAPEGGAVSPLPVPAPDAALFASLYPGDRINPKFWDQPAWAGSTPFGGPGIPEGYVPIASTDVIFEPDPTSPTVRIRIPVIGLDSTVAELALLDVADQRQYETPDNTVGHIPETAGPGEANNGWYFGHLSSLASGEGSVFRSLPDIAEHVRHDPVDVIIDRADGSSYIYRVTSTEQVHQDELRLTETPDSQITLCTCWPPRVFDRRILVHAELIAIKQG